MELPKELSISDFEKYRLQPNAWRETVADICSKHNIIFHDFQTFGTESSNLIASVSGNLVIKIFPPFHRHQWEGERRVLEQITNYQLSLSVPKLIAQGERADTWTYVIMSRVQGQPLDTIWSDLTRNQKAKIMHEIGRVMAQMHSVPVGTLSNLEPEWKKFLEIQSRQCHSRHKRLGMPEWFLNELSEYVGKDFSDLFQGEPVILTGEYTPYNLLVDRKGENWTLCGMIDFGDSMVGFREYDFDGPCLFLGEGDSLLIENLFEGYGRSSHLKDSAFKQRLMQLAILHRYSNLKFQARVPRMWERVRSISELADQLFTIK